MLKSGKTGICLAIIGIVLLVAAQAVIAGPAAGKIADESTSIIGPRTAAQALLGTTPAVNNKSASSSPNDTEELRTKFIRGDVNADGQVTNIDLAALTDYFYSAGDLVCTLAADIDNSYDPFVHTEYHHVVALADLVYLTNFLLASGPLPDFPFPDCGVDLDVGIIETQCGCGFAGPLVYVDVGESETCELIIKGNHASGLFSVSTESGDINGDGYDDLVVSAPNASSPGHSGNGHVYVFYGSAEPFDTSLISGGDNDVWILGKADGDQLGYDIQIADMNGDLYDDIIVTAHLADGAVDPDLGETYIIFGGSVLPAFLDLDTYTYYATIYGVT
ncbi:MAG: integrin alpha, partial [candidate division Zixibacteria bacterium]